MIVNLKELRTRYGISQQQLADEIGVSQQSINKYENHNAEPSIDTLKDLAAYFHTSIDYLVGYDSKEPINKTEAALLHIFNSMTAEQQTIFIEQGRAFLKTNHDD